MTLSANTPSSNRIGILIVCSLLSLLASCSSLAASQATDGGSQIEMAPELVDFWDLHGGLAILGSPIEPPQHQGSLVRQVFQNVELIHNPAAAADHRVRLAPLGWQLGLAEPAVPPPSDPDAVYFPITGHSLYAGFIQTYDHLGGESFLGAPITEVKFEGGRILQYFENGGLYREEMAPPSEVRMMALGALIKPDSPSPVAGQATGPVLTVNSHPFTAFLEQFGGEQTFGSPLSEPYLTPDGDLEQMYERAVIFSRQGQPDAVGLRPLGAALGPPDPPAPPSGDPDGLYFSETGHNVRWTFAEFYQSSQGELLLGLPLEEARVKGDRMSQRFENGILEYHFGFPDQLALQLAPLGKQYLADHLFQISSPTETLLVQPSPPPSTPASIHVNVATKVDHPLVAAGDTQIIYIGITDLDGTPLVGIVPRIAIYSNSLTFHPQATETDENGQSRVQFQVEELLPGEIVNYEVVISSGQRSGKAFGQFAILVGTPYPQPTVAAPTGTP